MLIHLRANYALSLNCVSAFRQNTQKIVKGCLILEIPTFRQHHPSLHQKGRVGVICQQRDIGCRNWAFSGLSPCACARTPHSLVPYHGSAVEMSKYQMQYLFFTYIRWVQENVLKNTWSRVFQPCGDISLIAQNSYG